MPDPDDASCLLPTPPHGAVLCAMPDLDGQPWAGLSRAPSCARMVAGSPAERGAAARRRSRTSSRWRCAGGRGGFAPSTSASASRRSAMTAARRHRRRWSPRWWRRRIPVEQYYAERARASTRSRSRMRRRWPPPTARSRARVDPRRRSAPRPGGLPGPQALADGGRQRRPRPFLPSGMQRPAATVSTTRRLRGALGGGRLFAVAGVLAHLPALCGLTAPSLTPTGASSPASGPAPSPAGPRQPGGGAARPSGFRGRRRPRPTSSSGHATPRPIRTWRLGGLIAAALDGLARGLRPPDPVQVDPADLPEAARPPALPRTQDEALNALEADGALMAALGEPLARAYLAVRRPSGPPTPPTTTTSSSASTS